MQPTKWFIFPVQPTCPAELEISKELNKNESNSNVSDPAFCYSCATINTNKMQISICCAVTSSSTECGSQLHLFKNKCIINVISSGTAVVAVAEKKQICWCKSSQVFSV